MDYCLGCDQLTFIKTYYILPNDKHFKYYLCPKCIDKLNVIVGNAELQNGGWDKPKQLEIPSYFLLLKNFIMGELK